MIRCRDTATKPGIGLIRLGFHALVDNIVDQESETRHISEYFKFALAVDDSLTYCALLDQTIHPGMNLETFSDSYRWEEVQRLDSLSRSSPKYVIPSKNFSQRYPQVVEEMKKDGLMR